MNKQTELNAIRQDERLKYRERAVLMSIVGGARLFDGKWIFSQPWPAWCFSLDMNQRALMRVIKALVDKGRIAQVSPSYSSQHSYEVLEVAHGEG